MKSRVFLLLLVWSILLVSFSCFAQQSSQTNGFFLNTNSLPNHNKLWIRVIKMKLRKDASHLSAAELWRRETMIKLCEDAECNDYLDQISSSIFKKTDVCDSSSCPGDTLINAGFILHQNGSISDITITGNTNAPVAPCLIQAIKNCPPLPKWPEKMYAIIGTNSWKMNINYGFNLTPPGLN